MKPPAEATSRSRGAARRCRLYGQTPKTPKAIARMRRRAAAARVKPYRRNKMGMVGLGIMLVFFFVVALAAPLITKPVRPVARCARRTRL